MWSHSCLTGLNSFLWSKQRFYFLQGSVFQPLFFKEQVLKCNCLSVWFGVFWWFFCLFFNLGDLLAYLKITCISLLSGKMKYLKASRTVIQSILNTPYLLYVYFCEVAIGFRNWKEKFIIVGWNTNMIQKANLRYISLNDNEASAYFVVWLAWWGHITAYVSVVRMCRCLLAYVGAVFTLIHV